MCIASPANWPDLLLLGSPCQTVALASTAALALGTVARGLGGGRTVVLAVELTLPADEGPETTHDGAPLLTVGVVGVECRLHGNGDVEVQAG